MSPATAEARRRVILMLLREGRIGPGIAESAAVPAPHQSPAEAIENARAAAVRR